MASDRKAPLTPELRAAIRTAWQRAGEGEGPFHIFADAQVWCCPTPPDIQPPLLLTIEPGGTRPLQECYSAAAEALALLDPIGEPVSEPQRDGTGQARYRYQLLLGQEERDILTAQSDPAAFTRAAIREKHARGQTGR